MGTGLLMPQVLPGARSCLWAPIRSGLQGRQSSDSTARTCVRCGTQGREGPWPQQFRRGWHRAGDVSLAAVVSSQGTDS